MTTHSDSSDADRLADLRLALEGLPGINAGHHRRIKRILAESSAEFGFDPQGRLKVAFYDARSYDTEAFKEANQNRFDFRFLGTELSLDTADATRGFRAACLFVNDACDAEIVAALAANGIEFLALRCAGFNNVDLQACARHGIDVARVPAYSPHAVAEHAIALMLTLNRKLHRAYQRNRAGEFVLDGLIGFDMKGKTVGIIGTGKIGRCVAGILHGFGCRVLAYDRYPAEDLATEGNLTYVPLEELFADSDIISLHAPLFPETRHLVNKQTLKQMKDGVMIINTSRGALIDTKALVKALKSGKVGAAGLDVYEEEAGIFFQSYGGRILEDDVLARLLTFDNVVVTSHQAFLTQEALRNIADTTLSNLEEYASGLRGPALTNHVAPPAPAPAEALLGSP